MYLMGFEPGPVDRNAMSRTGSRTHTTTCEYSGWDRSLQSYKSFGPVCYRAIEDLQSLRKFKFYREKKGLVIYAGVYQLGIEMKRGFTYA